MESPTHWSCDSPSFGCWRSIPCDSPCHSGLVFIMEGRGEMCLANIWVLSREPGPPVTLPGASPQCHSLEVSCAASVPRRQSQSKEQDDILGGLLSPSASNSILQMRKWNQRAMAASGPLLGLWQSKVRCHQSQHPQGGRTSSSPSSTRPG